MSHQNGFLNAANAGIQSHIWKPAASGHMQRRRKRSSDTAGYARSLNFLML
jgi:hypothetical protein